MQLHLSTWPEVEHYLQSSQGIIIPIGSTEQHGPTGLIGTDALCAQAIAWAVGENCEALVAPTLSLGMALHHLGFTGSLSLRPSTLIQVILDLITCLRRSGFKKFFFINGHGGNIATLKAAFAEAYDHLYLLGLDPQGEVQCQVGNWFMSQGVYQLAQELYGPQEGSHATPSEVALTQFLYPKMVKQAPLTPQVATGHPIYGAQNFRRHYPDGRMGSNPALACPEHGKKFYEAAVADLSASYQKFMATQ